MDIQFIANSNHVGEELRDLVFVRHNKRDLGGFNTFALDPDFARVDATDNVFDKIVDIFVRVAPSQGQKATLLSKTSFSSSEYNRALAEVASGIKVFSDGETTVAWYWDGSGMLFFARDGKAVINLDCKQEYGWQWVMW